MKKIIYILTAFLFTICCVPIFNACGEDVLTIWAYDQYVTAANLAKQIYAKENPDVKVNVIELSQDDLVEKFRIALASGNKNNLPDIIIEEDYNLKGYLRYYSDSFVDLTNSIDATQYADYKVYNVTYDNKIYGVPFDSGIACLYYRTDIINQAGFTDADMQDLTWDEFVEIGKVVKQKTGKYMLPICPEGNIEGRVILESTGKWYYDLDYNIDITDNVALIDMMNTMKQLYDSGVGYKVNGWNDIVSSFYNSDVTCVLGGNFWSPIIAENKEHTGLWRVASVPTINEQYTNKSSCSGDSWIVLNTDKKLQSIDFVQKTFATNLELMDSLIQSTYFIPSYKPAMETEIAQSGSEFFGGQNVCSLLSDWTLSMRPINYAYHSYEIAYTHGNLIADYINNKLSAQEVIDNLYSEVLKIEG